MAIEFTLAMTFLGMLALIGDCLRAGLQQQ